MSAEFVAIAREFSKVLAAAAETLEGAEAAEERAKVAGRRAEEHKAKFRAVNDGLIRIEAEHRAGIAKRQADQVREEAEANLRMGKARAEHETFMASANENLRRAGARLDALNKEVGELIKQRDDLGAQVAGLKATITDMAGKL